MEDDVAIVKSKQKKALPNAPRHNPVEDDRKPAPTSSPVISAAQAVHDAPVKPKLPSPPHEDMEITEPQSATVELAEVDTISTLQIPTILTPEEPAHSPLLEAPKELSMIAEENERSRFSIQQATEEDDYDSDEDMETEMMVPIKDEDATTTTVLNRKPSISQFGLPAPSPLKKSTRGPREPSVPPMLSQTPGAAMNNKRTSWLTKAKEAKAFEAGSGKKKATAAVGLGITTEEGTSTSRKRKSADMEEDVAITPSSSELAIVQEERKVKSARTSREEDVKRSHSSNRDETHSSREDMTHNSHSRTPSEAVFHHDVEEFTIAVKLDSSSEGALDRFRKTMDGGRTARSMGKSLGGAAAAALAEARAAAEARVAQRNKEEGGDVNMDASSSSAKAPETAEAPPAPVVQEKAALAPTLAPVPITKEHRLSISDLVPASAKQSSPLQTVLQAQLISVPSRSTARTGNASMSTTPPHSPPPPPPPAKPVETKPPTVFSKPVFTAPPKDQPRTELPAVPAAPSAGPSKAFSFKLPETTVFSRPIATTLGVPAGLSTSGSKPAPVSSQPSQASIFSDAIFDKEDDIPAWVPSTQDTDYSILPSQAKSHQEQLDELEAQDPIWTLEDKFASNNGWTPYGFASGDQDDTGSTFGGLTEEGMPTTQDFRNALQQAASEHAGMMVAHNHNVMEFVQGQSETEEGDVAMNVDTDGVDSELEDILRAGKSTISLVSVCFAP